MNEHGKDKAIREFESTFKYDSDYSRGAVSGFEKGLDHRDAEVSALRERVDKAEQLVQDFAAWSTKYPRSKVYPMSKINMDDELIELENRAKEIAEALTK